MPENLHSKIAIITGGGSGFGEGIVTKFIAEGASVLVVDVNEANAKKVATAQPKGRAVGLKADVSSLADWEEALKVVLATFGKLDVVVNNAGVTYTACV
jgi:3-oxoacyl-[acyl-carrier protein] reductase